MDTKITVYIFIQPLEGKKIEILNRNNRISFSIITGTEIVKSENSCNWTMKYMSVNGEGCATFVTDFKQKMFGHYNDKIFWK